MKKVILLLFVFSICSCSKQIDKKDLIGSWDCISAVNLDTGEIALPEDEEKLIVKINSDSIFIPDTGKEIFSWEIAGDSLIIKDLISVFIKDFNSNTLIVEYDFFGHEQLTFKKIK